MEPEPEPDPEPDPRWSVALADLLHERVERTPDAVALYDDLDRTLTFGQLDTHSRALAGELSAAGVGSGTRVAWQLPTWSETVILICALCRLGATQIPLPYAYRAQEVRTVVGQTDADLLITPGVWRDYDYQEMVTQLHPQVPRLRHLTLDRGDLDARPWFRDPPLLAPPGHHQELGAAVRWVFFTSGTAGAPKGARHTDRSLTVPATTMADAFELTEADRSAIAFPLGHVGGVAWLVASLQSGCSLLLAERLDDASIDRFADQGVTLAGVSTAFHLAYRDRARATGRRLFPQVRAYPGGAATKPPTLHAELRQEIGGVGIVSGYGLTECPMISMATVRDPDDKLAATEGRPGPGVVVEVRDPATGQPVPPGGEGELWVRGPQLFAGYVNAADTDAAMDERGFFRTGDLGRLDDEGYVVITGRLKDVIIRKGENISAKEVEDHLYTHPDVADVAVVGVPDDRVGERCCAVVVMRAGCGPLDRRAAGEHLQGRGLMVQKWPEQVLVVDALPRNAAGKVLKGDLVRLLSSAPDTEER